VHVLEKLLQFFVCSVDSVPYETSLREKISTDERSFCRSIKISGIFCNSG
jgi:hypothetical protein